VGYALPCAHCSAISQVFVENQQKLDWSFGAVRSQSWGKGVLYLDTEWTGVQEVKGCHAYRSVKLGQVQTGSGLVQRLWSDNVCALFAQRQVKLFIL